MAFQASNEMKERLEVIKKRYPNPTSAVMPALYLVQEKFGEIDDEAIEWIAQETDLTPVHVMELVTFYTMYRRKPLGKYHIQICRTLSCAICGSKKLSDYVRERLGVEPREVTQDGKWSFEQVECLGSCGTAPMCEINDTYFENLTPEKLGELMDRIEKENPDLSFSTTTDSLGDGLKGCPKSEVI